MSNDDGEGLNLGSRLTVELPADGTYRVSATSFQPGAMGAYAIQARHASANARIDQRPDAQPIQIGLSHIPTCRKLGKRAAGRQMQDCKTNHRDDEKQYDGLQQAPDEKATHVVMLLTQPVAINGPSTSYPSSRHSDAG